MRISKQLANSIAKEALAFRDSEIEKAKSDITTALKDLVKMFTPEEVGKVKKKSSTLFILI